VYNCKVTNVVTFGHVVSETREQTHKQIRRQTGRRTETERQTGGQRDKQTRVHQVPWASTPPGTPGTCPRQYLVSRGQSILSPHKVCPVSTRETARQLTSLTVDLYEHGAVLRLTLTRTGKTLSINQNCRHFRMNFLLNPVPLVLHRLRRDSRRSLWGQVSYNKRDSLIP